MSDIAKETVIIVHGTWAAPDRTTLKPVGAAPPQPAQRKWYELVDGRPGGESFPAKLDTALRKRGSSARCWAHCTQGNQIFHWSGDNSWIARTQAASALTDYVNKLRKEGWRCHVAAHSHGGNILIEALPQLMAGVDRGSLDGRLVTLGTPFIDTMSPILRRRERGTKLLDSLFWAVFAFLLYSFIGSLVIRALAIAQVEIPNGIVFAICPPALPFFGSGLDVGALNITLAVLEGLFLGAAVRRRMDERRASLRVPITEAEQIQPQLLVIGSLVDEAWQILHHMSRTDNPVAVRSNLLVYLFSSVRSAASESSLASRIHGAKSYEDLDKGQLVATILMQIVGVLFGTLVSGVLLEPQPKGHFADVIVVLLMFGLILFFVLQAFTRVFGNDIFSAAFSPLRWIVRETSALAAIFPALVTYGVRHLGWSVLLRQVMGLEGYRFNIPLIQQYPSTISQKLGKYENMPPRAEQRALTKRSAWIARHVGDVSQTFSNLVITADDLTSLLRAVEDDQTLVHAAYYSDDECITRIADWIAGRG